MFPVTPRKGIWIIFLLTFSFFKVSSQPLSGSYTIGIGASDYITIGQAINALEINGVSGNVIFNLLPGTYYEKNTITNIAGDSSFSITFQSSTADSNDVIINDTILNSNEALFRIDDSSSPYHRLYHFENLTLNTMADDFPECLHAIHCSVMLEHCLISTLYSINWSGNASYLISAINIGNFNIDSCTLSGALYGFVFNGGNYNISNSHFIHNGLAAIYPSVNSYQNHMLVLESNNLEHTQSSTGESLLSDCDSTIMNNNVFGQSVSITDGNNALISNNVFNRHFGFNVNFYCLLDNNQINSVFFGKASSALVQYNIFNSMPANESTLQTSHSIVQYNKGTHIDINSCNNVTVQYCNFEKIYCSADTFLIRKDTVTHPWNGLDIGGNSGLIDSCFLQGFVLIQFAHNVSFKNNIIVADANIIGSDYIVIEGNMLQNISCQNTSNTFLEGNRIQHLIIWNNNGLTRVFNNYISVGFDITFNNDSVLVYSNNIHMQPPVIGVEQNNAALFCPLIFFRNNNLNKDIAGDINSDYNNYFPAGGDTELHSIYVDPMYTDSNDLTAHNPILAGKGFDLSGIIADDINGKQRFNPPTIGANEICATNSSANNFQINCGDFITLNACNYDSTYSYSWAPALGLTDTAIPNPVLIAQITQSYICTITLDTTVIEIDTVNIDVIPFQVHAEDVSIQYCGYGLYLNSTWNASATYHWSPSTGLSDTTIRNPFANPHTTTTYVVEASVPNCGTTYDTVKVTVDSLPVAYVYILTQDHNVISFLNASTCADSYLWLFGDNTSDTVLNPTHTYYSTGWILLTLIAYNTFGSDTYQGYVFVDSVTTLTPLISVANSELIIFPNPVSTTLEFNLKTFEKGAATIEVINEWAEKEVSESISIESDNYLNSIDVSKLASGFYLLKISGKNQMLFKKFIKL